MGVFAERFTELRKQSGLTQEEVAKKLNLSKGTIGNYESGLREPRDFETLEEIADFFNCKIDYLVGRSDEKPYLSLEDEWIIKCYKKADENTKLAIKILLSKFGGS